MKKLSFLSKMVKQLNAPVVYKDGATEESLYHFVIEERNNRVVVYDTHENYHINWLEDTNYEMKELCEEFGRTFKPLETDIIHDKLEKALKMDLGEKAYFEWENNVVLAICE